jgi:hypothetical protein
MSLLREAERCVANQYAHNFNAFITPLSRAGPWLDRVKEADARRDEGSSTGLPLSTSELTDMIREIQVRSGRPLDLHQRQHLHTRPSDNLRFGNPE